MAKTKGKPGPQPKYGERREYHFRLPATPLHGESMSLADAFDKVSDLYGGDNAYINWILRSRSEIASRLKG